MSTTHNLADAVAAALGRRVRDASPVGGGYLNDAWRVELEGGGTAFVKTRAGAVPGEYAGEAAGLDWLAEAGGLAVPEVLAVADPPDRDAPAPRLLALGWIDEGRLDGAGEEELGRGLAAVHAAGAPAFGALPDGPAPAPERDADSANRLSTLRIGPLELPSDPTDSWTELYAEQRLRPLVRVAVDRGVLPGDTATAVERVCERLPELAGPSEPPARLHGDLWSGNVLADARGRPHLIDPAAYGGHREVDLAMLRLFGGPGERCFAAYDEAAPLTDGHAERVELWQLFPMLVHAVLFGGGYGESVARIARHYGSG